MAVGAKPLVPSRLAPGGVAHGSRRVPTTRIGGFIALTKPRIIELLLITTVPTMVLAEQGWPRTTLVLITLLGGTLAAGGANAVNMVVDRDIDRRVAVLETLAASTLFTTQDWPAFHAQAREGLRGLHVERFVQRDECLQGRVAAQAAHARHVGIRHVERLQRGVRGRTAAPATRWCRSPIASAAAALLSRGGHIR